MSGFYELIGRIVVGLIRWRYERELRAAAVIGVAATALAIGAYIATRGKSEED